VAARPVRTPPRPGAAQLATSLLDEVAHLLGVDPIQTDVDPVAVDAEPSKFELPGERYRPPDRVVVRGRARRSGGDADVEVRDAMTEAARVVTVSPETPLKQVAELMLEHRISGLPVVDEERRVLGVISEADVVGGETGGTGETGMIARARAVADPGALAIPRTAGEAMGSPAVTIRPDETVMQAAHQIAERDVNRLPVVDEDGRLVGIIARADVVRAFARSDEQIEDAVRREVERSLGLGSDRLRVAVADGEVLLSGEVESDAKAKLAAFFATRVPGVVAVRSDLRVPPGEEDQGDSDESAFAP
jgi:CBS domain-containing protein